MKNVLEMNELERKLYIKNKAKSKVYNKLKEQINIVKELRKI